MNKKMITVVALGLTGHSMMAMEPAEKEKKAPERKSWMTTNKLIGAGAVAGAGALAYKNKDEVKALALQGYNLSKVYGAQAADWAKKNPGKAATYGLGTGVLLYAGYRFLQREDSVQQKIAQPDNPFEGEWCGTGSKHEQDARKQRATWLAGENGLIYLLRLVYPEDGPATIIQPLVTKAFKDPHVLLNDAKLINDMAQGHQVQLIAICIMFLQEQVQKTVIELIDSLSDKQQTVRLLLADTLSSDDPLLVIEMLNQLVPADELTDKQRNEIILLSDFMRDCFEKQRVFLENQGFLAKETAKNKRK
jgi:hypothetical protein